MQKRNRAVKKIILYVILAVFVIAALFPIYWMLNTSLKPNNEIYNLIPTFFPKKISLDGYKRLFFKTGFFTHMKNSIMVSSVTSVVSVFFSMLAAYAIARFRFRGKNLISRGIIYSYLMPRSVMYIPLYLFVVQVGLNNSLGALYLIYPTFVIPYATWMLISYFKSIPKELEDAAMIDGCTRIGTLRRIIFPLSLPGIMSTIIFSFTLCWSEYLYAFVIISDDLQKTITLGLSDLIVDDLYAWGALMGGAAISTIPVVLLYMFSSGYLVTGNVAGGVKG